jgi:hypothetical protein
LQKRSNTQFKPFVAECFNDEHIYSIQGYQRDYKKGDWFGWTEQFAHCQQQKIYAHPDFALSDRNDRLLYTHTLNMLFKFFYNKNMEFAVSDVGITIPIPNTQDARCGTLQNWQNWIFRQTPTKQLTIITQILEWAIKTNYCYFKDNTQYL